MSAHLSGLALRARLAGAALGPVAVGALAALVAAALALAWVVPHRLALRATNGVALARAALPPAAQPVAPAVAAGDNLARFYAALGEHRYAEQQVATLFGLAAKTGLTLTQGEYKPGYDQNARVTTYQVVLPVKGSYKAMWEFAMLALDAIPFAALDDISFKRETIGDVAVDARIKFTLFLDAGGRP